VLNISFAKIYDFRMPPDRGLSQGDWGLKGKKIGFANPAERLGSLVKTRIIVDLTSGLGVDIWQETISLRS